MFIFHFEVSRHTGGGGGGGSEKMPPNVTWGEGGSKNCQKSVTYYLNGPLNKI
jgi:hypothetical protein